MIQYLLFVSLLIHATSGQKPAGGGGRGPLPPPGKKWLTLNGDAPAVVARGGFSGLFPEYSDLAYQMAVSSSIEHIALQCSLQLTKDGFGICLEDINIVNSTTISDLYPNQTKTYTVNGQDLTGYFTIDYMSEDLLSNASLLQNIYSRPSVYDGQLPILSVDDALGAKPPVFWLHVEYDAFYAEHNLSIASFIQQDTRLHADYISSPEIKFLTSLSGKMKKAPTKFMFVFQDKKAVEPTTNQTYGAILADLSKVKLFASGIVVPKDYIWPVNTANYLEPPTTLVQDAHKLGLEVYASGFANDFKLSYNYTYDPVSEYLQFIDNGLFSVDGVISDFPSTASEAVACFAQFNATQPPKGHALIITHNGASGVYAGCTDLAYQQAIDDGADIIDCSVQMSKDGEAFCLDSADLTGDTTALTTLMSQSRTIPEIQKSAGIFSFDFAWTDIQALQPQLVSPLGNNAVDFPRNPAEKNKGKFVTLAGFLDLAKTKAVSGVLIDIRNAAYLASQMGLDIVDAVNKALINATFDKQSTQQVLIQSDDSSVLSKFQNVPAYKRVLYIDEEIGDAPKQSLSEIKKYADAVNLPRSSIVPSNNGFTMKTTPVVEEMQKANISVYVSVFMNEFITLPFDFFSDPTIEIATFIAGAGVDGIITEYPATASRYLRNPCADTNAKIDYPILPAEGGSLLSSIPAPSQPPATAPNPALEVADIVDPPLPAVAAKPQTTTPTPTAAPAGRSSAMANVANLGGIALLSIVVFSLLSQGY